MCYAVLHTDTRGVGSNAVEAGGIDVEQLGVRVSGVAGVVILAEGGGNEGLGGDAMRGTVIVPVGGGTEGFVDVGDRSWKRLVGCRG